VTLFPVPVRVPTVAFPFWTPSTDQVTAVLVEPLTVAVRSSELPASRVAEVGLKVTTAFDLTLTEAEERFAASAVLVAVMV
jgi:hypothetical protein